LSHAVCRCAAAKRERLLGVYLRKQQQETLAASIKKILTTGSKESNLFFFWRGGKRVLLMDFVSINGNSQMGEFQVLR
jgi:hypothetical protein